MATTLKDEFFEIAVELGLTFEEIKDGHISKMIGPTVPERFRHLVAEVMLRLPGSWDNYNAFWRVDVGAKESPSNCHAPLCWIEEADPEQGEIVIKITPWEMSRFSDAACSWIIAQCFAYIAFKMLPSLSVNSGTGEILTTRLDEHPHADTTRIIALWWGFEREFESYYKEVHSQNKRISQMIN